MFWEAKIFLKCDFAKKYSILFYILCGFWKFSRYHSQLSILCSVSFYEYHKNSFENFRTDVKIGIFPIPIELWSGFGFSSKIGRIPTRSGCLDSLHRHTTFMASFTCLRLTRLNEFRCRFLVTSFKFSIVFFFQLLLVMLQEIEIKSNNAIRLRIVNLVVITHDVLFAKPFLCLTISFM